MTELTLHEQQAVAGGDWWDRYMEVSLGFAFAAGLLGAPIFIGGAALGGIGLLATGNSGWNWF